ncbi:hypothetical protein [Kangiella sp. M94]
MFKQQVIRIAINYSRMILTFLIGLLIIKLLITEDKELYSVYVLVTMGLGLGAMFRELLRASIVPFLSLKGDAGINENYSKSLYYTLQVILLFLACSFVLYSLKDFLEISPAYQSSFDAFYWARVIGAALLLLSFPALNVLAYNNQMVRYNLWFLFERVGEFLSVLLIIPANLYLNYDEPLLVNATVFLAWAIFQSVYFIAIFHKSHTNCLMRPKRYTREERTYLFRQLKANLLLIINMALYYRATLVLINILFGSSVSVVYGLIVQLATYIKQVATGLVTGIDSFFAKTYKNKGESKQAVKIIESLNMLIMLPFSTFVVIVFPFLLNFITEQKFDTPSHYIHYLFALFMIGIVIRSLSEHWMGFLSGIGHANLYTGRIVIIASLVTASIFGIYYLKLEQPIFWIGVVFIIGMVASHFFIVPWQYSLKTKTRYGSNIYEILLFSAIYTTMIIVSFYINNTVASLGVLTVIFALHLLTVWKQYNKKLVIR